MREDSLTQIKKKLTLSVKRKETGNPFSFNSIRWEFIGWFFIISLIFAMTGIEEFGTDWVLLFGFFFLIKALEEKK